MLGDSLYSIEYQESVVSEDIPTLPTTARSIIKRAVEERLTTDPIAHGKPLRYSLKGFRRLFLWQWQVFFLTKPV